MNDPIIVMAPERIAELQKHFSQVEGVCGCSFLGQEMFTACLEHYKMSDPVNHPSHYRSHPSGVECIQITEHMNFCLGNAVKYIWRAGLKSPNAIEDLKKAEFYIKREIERLSKPASLQTGIQWEPRFAKDEETPVCTHTFPNGEPAFDAFEPGPSHKCRLCKGLVIA